MVQKKDSHLKYMHANLILLRYQEPIAICYVPTEQTGKNTNEFIKTQLLTIEFIEVNVLIVYSSIPVLRARLEGERQRWLKPTLLSSYS